MSTTAVAEYSTAEGPEELLPFTKAKQARLAALDGGRRRSPHLGTKPRTLVGVFDWTVGDVTGFGEVFAATDTAPVTVSINVRSFPSGLLSEYVLDYGTEEVRMFVAGYSMADPTWVHLHPVPADARHLAPITHRLTVSEFEGSR